MPMGSEHASARSNLIATRAQPRRDGADKVHVAVFFATIFLTSLGFLWWSEIKLLLGVDISTMAVQPFGTVQRVSFISNLGYDTQVDTETRSLLLSGFAEIPRGTPLELRTEGQLRIVCASGTAHCWRLLGR